MARVTSRGYCYVFRFNEFQQATLGDGAGRKSYSTLSAVSAHCQIPRRQFHGIRTRIRSIHNSPFQIRFRSVLGSVYKMVLQHFGLCELAFSLNAPPKKMTVCLYYDHRWLNWSTVISSPGENIAIYKLYMVNRLQMQASTCFKLK